VGAYRDPATAGPQKVAAHARQHKRLRSDRTAPGARESVPQGHLIVAHYEVVGRVFSKATRPARDDRLAACAREAVCEPRTEGSIVPYRDGAVFQLLTQHFRTGLLSNVPADEVLSECYLVHQVSDWCSGAAAYFGWMREAKRENTRCGL
jgi:hypothetical protein